MGTAVQLTAVLSTLLLFLTGCGGKGQKRVAVSGEVTFQGQALDRGRIQFLTTQGPRRAASGAVIHDGRYDIPREQGLEPGVYQVIVESPVVDPGAPREGLSSPPTKERIPPEYSSAQESQLKVEITAGAANRFDVTIE